LPGDFFGGFEICLKSGLFDTFLLGGLAGIDIDGNQRFGLLDDDGTARV
jgi:hypothetical protein